MPSLSEIIVEHRPLLPSLRAHTANNFKQEFMDLLIGLPANAAGRRRTGEEASLRPPGMLVASALPISLQSTHHRPGVRGEHSSPAKRSPTIGNLRPATGVCAKRVCNAPIIRALASLEARGGRLGGAWQRRRRSALNAKRTSALVQTISPESLECPYLVAGAPSFDPHPSAWQRASHGGRPT